MMNIEDFFRLPYLILILLYVICKYNGENISSCGVFVKSSCNDEVTTTWNRKDISYNLKSWIKSIERIGYLADVNVLKNYQRKKMRKDYDSKRLTYIGNVDCLTRRSVGKIWKTPEKTLIKKDQFQNGFLYGLEDTEGKLTGWCMISRLR